MSRWERRRQGRPSMSKQARQRTIPGILARAGQDIVNMQGEHMGNVTSTGKGSVGKTTLGCCTRPEVWRESAQSM